MVAIQLINANQLLPFIKAKSEQARQARVAVAFARRSGLNLLEKQIESTLNKGAKWDFLVGLDFAQTEGIVLQQLLSWSNQYKDRFSFACYSDPAIDRTPMFHPKVYLFHSRTKATGVVGSSNLTGGGLGRNIEANVALIGSRSEIEETGLPAFFASLKFQQSCFTPDTAYIERYESIRKRVASASRKVLARPSTKKEVEHLRKAEVPLVIKPRDPATLTGWQKLVYKALPESEFSTHDIYRYADDFRNHYPENKNVEAKIRQILQQLRDEGIILHPGTGLWKVRR